MFEMFGWILIALGLIIIGRVLFMKEARKMEYKDLTSKVYSCCDKETDDKQYELTIRMKQQAEEILRGYQTNNVLPVVDNSRDLAETVLEFLKVSGWSRS